MSPRRAKPHAPEVPSLAEPAAPKRSPRAQRPARPARTQRPAPPRPAPVPAGALPVDPNAPGAAAPLPPPSLHPRPVGFVGLAGAPNVGKSTLVNHLIGQKISIVSDRPQTTRERVCGIYTDENLQAVLVDIPGIMGKQQAGDPFNRSLLECASQSLADCEVVLHLRDARRRIDPVDEPVRALLARTNRPRWLVWNKLDRVPSRMFHGDLECDGLTYERVFGISARTGKGLPKLLEALASILPTGPLLYDPDQLCDRDLRFLASELVREKLFRYLGEEVPYGLATQTEVFDENNPEKVVIRVLILTEREAHKPIIIGHGGAMLRRVGQAARLELEKLTGRPVFLELWVKVRAKWRKNNRILEELGLKSGN